MKKNNVHYTRFSFMRQGSFFDQQLIKAKEGLFARKKGMDSVKYGGYNRLTASFYLLTNYILIGKKDKKDLMIVPVNLLDVKTILDNPEKAYEYVRKEIAHICKKDVKNIANIDFPLGIRPIKVNTMFEMDGYRYCLTSKTNDQLGFVSMVPLYVNTEKESYIKKLSSFSVKYNKNKNIEVNEKYDGINVEKNIDLYKFLLMKLEQGLFKKAFGNQYECLQNGMNQFSRLAVNKQVEVLLNIIDIFKTSRSNACNLVAIGGKPNVGKIVRSVNLSNWKKYGVVRIIEQSASGIYESKSVNLLEFI